MKEKEENMLTKGQKLYYARIIPTVNIYEVCDLSIRTIADTYFTGIDKHDKHVYLFSYKDIGQIVFKNRKEALDKVLAMEENKIAKPMEKYYEEY